MSFFKEEVTQNVRKTAIIGFAITGLLAVIGSLFLVRDKKGDVSFAE